MIVAAPAARAPSPPTNRSESGWTTFSSGAWRSARLDALVIGGWLLCAAAGQWATSAESPVLEQLAVGWLWLGVLIVRPVWCLPLLLLSAPLFMCESHRAWSWVQPAAAWVLLARVFAGNRFTARQAAAVTGLVAAVLLLSWPADGARLLAEYLSFTPRQMLDQWLRPEATWAVFPFRSAVDRALAAALVSTMVLSGRYLSGRRVWTALWLSALMMLLGAYAPVLVPGHAPHTFLGTSNYGIYVTSLFHGAGYNLHYLNIGIAAGVAYFFLPLRTPERPVRLASGTLLLPVLLVRQRALALAIMVLVALAVALLADALRRRRGRLGLTRRSRRLGRREKVVCAAGVAFSLVLVAGWALKLQVRDHDSELRFQLRARVGSFFSLKALPPSAYYPSKPASPGLAAPPEAPSPPAEARTTRAVPLPPARRTAIRMLADRLIALDDTRGPMWVLGVQTILREHTWRGAGAGTWARFHRSQPRPSHISFSHLHNTFLDLTYEYGLVPMALLFTLAGIALGRLVVSAGGAKVWLFYLAGIGVVASGQHLFYSFSSLVATLPAAMVLSRELLRSRRASRPPAGQLPAG